MKNCFNFSLWCVCAREKIWKIMNSALFYSESMIIWSYTTKNTVNAIVDVKLRLSTILHFYRASADMLRILRCDFVWSASVCRWFFPSRCWKLHQRTSECSVLVLQKASLVPERSGLLWSEIVFFRIGFQRFESLFTKLLLLWEAVE